MPLSGPVRPASEVPFTPAGTVAATNVQTAIEEVASEGAAGISQLWLHAGEFASVGASSGAGATYTNTPATAFAGRYGTWLLDSGIEETLGLSVFIPSTWATFAVDVYWANPNASSGNVVWQLATGFRAVGDSLNTGYTASSTTTSAAGSQYILVKVTQVGGADFTNTSTSLFGLRVLRSAANASDTLANDAALVGVMLRKVT